MSQRTQTAHRGTLLTLRLLACRPDLVIVFLGADLLGILGVVVFLPRCCCTNLFVVASSDSRRASDLSLASPYRTGC